MNDSIIKQPTPLYAIAYVKGSPHYPEIHGTVIFRKKGTGVLVTAEIWGLPHEESKCDERIFAMHIHNGASCSGNERDPFADAGTHLNLDSCIHPEHTGDLPPLFRKSWVCLSICFNESFHNIRNIRQSNYHSC